MKTWQPASARLLNVSGTDSRTEASYRYEIGGVSYQNDRVHVAVFPDSIGNYQTEIRERLSQLQSSNQPVAIWVNPDDPWDSVIDRDMRWGLFSLMTGFCSLFILVGLGVIYGSLKASKQPAFRPPSTTELRREWEEKKTDAGFRQSFIEYRRYRLHELEKQSEQVQEVHKAPGAWREKKGWETERIRSQAKAGLIGMWVFAITWNAVSSPLLFVFEEEWQEANYAILMGLLFPLVGLFLLAKAIAMTREFRRYGVIEFVMDPYPGAIGGHVGGSLQVNNLHEYDDRYRIELECVYSYESGSGEDRRRSERIRWAEGGHAKVENLGRGALLSFRFDVPEDQPEADIEQSGDYYFWRLKVRAEVPGIDLNRSYNIPVFKTGERSRHVDHDLSAQAQALRETEEAESRVAIERGDFHLTDLARSLRSSETQREIRIYFPMFRNKLLTVFAVIFGGGFDFAAYSIVGGFGSGGGVFGILAIVVAIPFSLVGLFATIAAIYLPLNNLTITIANGEVKVLRRLFVFPILHRRIQDHEVTRLSIKRSGSTGQGTKKIEHHKIIAHYGVGKTITVAEGIDGEDLANQFKDYLFRRIQSGY